MRRVLRWIALGLLVFGGTILGLAGAAFGTAAGRDAVLTFALELANRNMTGRLTVGAATGAPLRGLMLARVTVTDTAGRTVFSVDTFRLRYNAADLLSGDIVLGSIALERPVLTLERRPGGRWNIEEVLRLGEGDSAAGGPSLLIAFRNVRIRDALITLDGATPRTIAISEAMIPYLRLSSPLPGQQGVLAEFDTLALAVSDPALHVGDAIGSVRLADDTLWLDLDRVALPGTDVGLLGWVVPGDPLTFDVALDARRLDAMALAAFTGDLPDGIRRATGSGRVRLTSDRADALVIGGERLAIEPGNGGSVMGRVGFALNGDRWSMRRTDVTTTNASLALLGAVLDTVPFTGRLTGRTRADGPADSLAVRLDWAYADGAVDGAPVSRVAAEGPVALGGPAGVRFIDLGITRAELSLATVHALVPSVALRGHLDLAGTITGPRDAFTFSGTVRHRDARLPPSVARGTVHLDTREPDIAFAVDLAFDSLATDGLHPSYPALPLYGSLAGDVRLEGRASRFRLDVALAGPSGRFTGGAVIVPGEHLRAVTDVDLSFAHVAPAVLADRLDSTRVTGRVIGGIAFDSTAVRRAALALTLTSSTIGAVPIDSAVLSVSDGPAVLRVDTVAVWGPGIGLAGAGALGKDPPARGTLRAALSVDSLGVLRPLLGALAMTPPDSLAGRADAELTVAGALGALDLDASFDVRNARWDAIRVPEGRVTVARGADGTTRLGFRADTAAYGALGFGGVVFTLAGDSLAQPFRGRARMGDFAALLVGGSVQFDDGLAVRLDSLAVLADRSVWFLQRAPVTLAVTDTLIRFDSLTLAHPAGAGRMRLAGTIPLAGAGGAGAFTASVEALPMAELWALLQRDPAFAEGELSGTFSLHGTARDPVMEGGLALRQGAFGAFHAPYVEIALGYRERGVSGTVGLWRAGEEILAIDIALPMDLAIAGATRRRLPGPISIRARADRVDLALLDALTPAVRNTRGRFSADLGVTGTWDEPALTGRLSIQNGGATLPALGVQYERLNGQFTLERDAIVIRELNLASGEGAVEARGTIRLEELTRAELDLTLAGTDFHALDIPGDLAATVSGNVRLRGPLFGATLTGRATVTSGAVWFADILQKDVIDLEDSLYAPFVDREVLRRQGLGTDVVSMFFDSLRIDGLSLAMGNDAWLRSNEADIQLTGALEVDKEAAQYQIAGTLNTPRGTYRLQLVPQVEGFEREFVVERGEVRYFGTSDLDAALDVDARHIVRSRRGEDVTVTVHIGGTITDPTLTLSSDHRPPLSDTEIISYLLVGAPSVAAAGAGGALGQFGSGFAESIAARLTGQFGSALIANLGLPLDYFEVRPQFGVGGAAGEVAVGVRLGERWLVTANPRICPREQWTYRNIGASVEFRINQEFRLAASADPLGTCGLFGSGHTTQRYQLGVDLLWESSYE